MDLSTEFASDFTFERYHALRKDLTPNESSDEAAWTEVIDAVQRRIEERFLTPINELARFDHDEKLKYRPGFAILWSKFVQIRLNPGPLP